MGAPGVGGTLRQLARALARGGSVVLALACSGKTDHAGSGGGVPPAESPGGATLGEPSPPHHLLMVVELVPAAKSARVLLARGVDLPLPARRGPVRSAPWRVEVLAEDGALLFSAPLADGSELRAELVEPGTGELRGVRAQKRVTAVTLRLPRLAAAKHVRVVDVAGGELELGRVDYPRGWP